MSRGIMMIRQIAMWVVGVSALSAGALSQVNLPPGFELVEFGVNDKYTGVPAINECGQIVYTKDIWENSRLFLYDNGRITQLTQYDKGRLVMFPDINNAGTIVWTRKPEGYEGEVLMLRNGETVVIGEDRSPTINNHGHVAYTRFRGRNCNASLYDIMIFDGQRSRRVYRNDWSDQDPIINDSGWITWSHANFCVVPWLADLVLYDGERVLDLLGKSAQYGPATLNDRGQVAWSVPDEVEVRHNIFVWENGNVWRLPTNISVENPAINNSGDLFYLQWTIEANTREAWVYGRAEPEPRFYRLTDDRFEDGDGDINDQGEVAWQWVVDPPQGRWGGGLRFLRQVRSGDAQFDGDISLLDLSSLIECMSGPGPIDRTPETSLCECRFLDIDHDDDVDLADFARFQNAFTGGG